MDSLEMFECAGQVYCAGVFIRILKHFRESWSEMLTFFGRRWEQPILHQVLQHVVHSINEDVEF